MNTLKKQFSDALKREGKSITTYYKSETVKCLFRKKDDGNNQDNHITIFYDKSAPIAKGKLLTYGTENYLVLNQESVENDTYYKSTLLECNLTIPVTINSVQTQIPCYSYELSSAYATSGTVISVVDGKGEIITELIAELSTTGYLNTGLRIMGGYYKVTGMYNLDGISHLMIEREAMPADVYTLDITTPTGGYKVGETSQITAVTTLNGEVVTGQTFTYISSDNALATIDANGLITFIAVGTVTITGTWSGHSATDTITIVISAADIPPSSYTMTIATNGDLIVGGSTRTYTPTLKDGSGNVITTWTAVWTFNYNGMPTSDFTITYSGKNCIVKVAENYDIIDNHLILTCTTTDNLATGSFSAVITA